MKDLKRTDIEDIDRQMHNYRTFSVFLKKHNLYRFIREKMFTFYNRTPLDLMKTISRTGPRLYVGNFNSSLMNEIDRKWALVFIYVPFFGGYWSNDLNIKIEYLSDIKGMQDLHEKWKEFLFNNNYDKMKESDDSTFTFD
jgi:hypothetical protein